MNIPSKQTVLIIGVLFLASSATLFLLFTNQPFIKLLRYAVFTSFQFEGDEIGTIEKNIIYKTVGGKPLMVDIYMPFVEKHDPMPVVVFSHGGGWVVGDRKTMLIGPDNR